MEIVVRLPTLQQGHFEVAPTLLHRTQSRKRCDLEVHGFDILGFTHEYCDYITNIYTAVSFIQY